MAPIGAKDKELRHLLMFFTPTNRRGPRAAEIDQNVVAGHIIEFDIANLPLKGSQAVFGRRV
jgi:hypothetical protein